MQFIYPGFISILGITFEALLYADIRLVDKSLSLHPISFRYIRYPTGDTFELNCKRQSILHSQASTRTELFLKHLADSSCCGGFCCNTVFIERSFSIMQIAKLSLQDVTGICEKSEVKKPLHDGISKSPNNCLMELNKNSS